MGVINFLPIQPGEGDPSPINRRPIYPPLNIDGIGVVWGGSIDTNECTLIRTYAEIEITADYVSKRRSFSGNSNNRQVAFMDWLVANVWLVPRGSSYVSGRSDGYCSVSRYLVNNYAYFPRACVVESTAELVINGIQTVDSFTQWLEDNGPVQIVFPIASNSSWRTPLKLTTAQLHQALEQLNVPISSMQEVMHQIAMDAPHIVTHAPARLHTFSTDMAAPLKACKVYFSPVQEGTGDPSPENERPISGWTGIELYRTGKNLFNKNADISNNKFYIISDGTETTSANYRTTDFIPVKPSTSYYWAINGTDPVDTGSTHSAPRVAFYDENKQWISSSDALGRYGSSMISPANAVYARLPVYTVKPNTVATAMFVEGTTLPTTYEPFGQTANIDWTSIGEIPGGYVDLVRGVIVKNVSMLTLNDIRNWNTANASSGVFRAGIMVSPVLGGLIPQVLMCDTFKSYGARTQSQASTLPDLGVCCRSSYNNIYFRDVRYTTLTDFLNAHGNDTIAYSLDDSTWFTYPIDPVTLKTLRGLNNIWSSANGEIELSYWTH